MTDRDSEKRISKVELLESAPHFAFFSFDEKKSLVRYMITKKFEAGDFIIREGEDMNTIFFLLGGRVEVFKTDIDGAKKRLALLGAGEIIGESAINPQEPPTSTAVIRAAEKIVALGLTNNSYSSMMANDPGIAFKIAFDIIRVLRGRLNDASEKLADKMDNQ